MITFDQVQADPSLANAYVTQQAGILNEQGGTGGTAGNPNLTMGQQYLAANPDVFENATARAQAEGIAPGQAFQNRVDQIAREHFDAFGMNEGRSGFGYTFPSAGTFAPSAFDGPPATSGPSSSGGSLSGLGAGMTQMPTFDTSAYESALNNFGGLLNNFNSFFGGIMSGAQSPMSNFSPYAGYPNANYVSPFFNASPYFGAGGFGGFNSGSPFASPARGSANTGHNMLWTT